MCTAFRINVYLVLCYPLRNTTEYQLNLLVVGAICETPKRKIIVQSYRATGFFIIIFHLPPGYPIISSKFKMAAVSVKRSCRWKVFLGFHWQCMTISSPWDGGLSNHHLSLPSLHTIRRSRPENMASISLACICQDKTLSHY